MKIIKFFSEGFALSSGHIEIETGLVTLSASFPRGQTRCQTCIPAIVLSE